MNALDLFLQLVLDQAWGGKYVYNEHLLVALSLSKLEEQKNSRLSVGTHLSVHRIVPH